MKKYLSVIMLLLAGFLSVGAVALFDDGDIIKKYISVRLKDGRIVKYLIEDVDSIMFGDSTIHVPTITSVEFSKKELNLEIGESAALTYKVLEADADQKVSISISDANKISYSQGIVRALAEGKATIVATASDNIHSDTCYVTITKKPEPPKNIVKSVYFGDDSHSAEENGKDYYLTAHVDPENAIIDKVEWTVSNPRSARIVEYDDSPLECHVYPLLEGVASITITINDTISATHKLIVEAGEKTYPVTGVSLSSSSLAMEIGDTKTLTAIVVPSNATNKSVSWSSSNSAVASVSNGVITAKSAGSATITVKTADGSKTATCNVTVKAPEVIPGPEPEPIAVTGLTLSSESAEIATGNTYTIRYEVTPSNATNKSVTFSSSNTSVATVSSSGVVTAKAKGEAVITVTTLDGNFSKEFVVNVISVPASISAVSTMSTTATTADIMINLSGDLSTISEMGIEYTESDNFDTTEPQVRMIRVPASSQLTTLEGLKEETTYKYRVFILVDNDRTYGNEKSFLTKSSNKFKIAEAVDLGLPSGLKWSSWNMGASELGGIGGHYCWGDAEGEQTDFNAYANPSGADNIIGNKKYDIATAQWGSSWRMPYRSEWEELFKYCKEELIEMYVNGNKVQVKKMTGRNGNYILIPRAGYYRGTDLRSNGTQGFYWTGESSIPSKGERYYFTFSTAGSNWSSIQHGAYRMNIRPVSGAYVPPLTQEDYDRMDVEGETSAASASVDLGLSVRWATCNVGTKSKKPSERGGFYAWAETHEKDVYSFTTYDLTNGSDAYRYIGDDIKNVEDNTLYDVAAKTWGGKWRMPTDAELAELFTLKREWTTVDGVPGYRIYGKDNYSSNSIFLPVTGYMADANLMNEDTHGYYWSSTLYSVEGRYQWNESAWYISFTKDSFSDTYFSRYVGRCIRPVKPLREVYN